jgi:hypothetical protein
MCSSLNLTLYGQYPFYKNVDYQNKVEQSFSNTTSSRKANFVYDSHKKISFLAKRTFSLYNMPGYFYFLTHHLLGKYTGIFPSACPSLFGILSEQEIHSIRRFIPVLLQEWNESNQEDWVVKRLCIEVQGYQIDAMLIGKASMMDNRRWLLFSEGNTGRYEEHFKNKRSLEKTLSILRETQANAVFFNYPGVGASQGFIDRELIRSTYRGMFSFIEDPEKGLGAKEIIAYGHSMGGAVQGDALDDYPFREGVKHVFVKSRTYSSLGREVYYLKNPFLGSLVHIFDWNINPLRFTIAVKKAEIILQTVKKEKEHKEGYFDLKKRKLCLIHDGMIPAEASLARAVLKLPQSKSALKTIIGHHEMHGEHFRNFKLICRHITAKLINPYAHFELTCGNNTFVS